MQKKLIKHFLVLRWLHLNLLRETLAFTERQYFSLGLNMLSNRLKIWDTNKTELFVLVSFQNEQKYNKITALQI